MKSPHLGVCTSRHHIRIYPQTVEGGRDGTTATPLTTAWRPARAVVQEGQERYTYLSELPLFSARQATSS